MEPITAIALVAGLFLGGGLLFFYLHRPAAVHSLGLADLLIYGDVLDDGIFVHKNGALAVVLELRGPDITTLDPESYFSHARLLHEVLPRDERWILSVDALHTPAPGYPAPGAFPTPILHLLDQERRQSFTSQRNFETHVFLTLTLAPAIQLPGRLRAWFVESESPLVGDPVLEALEELEAIRDELPRALRGSFTVRPLDAAEATTFLRACATGQASPVALPPPFPRAVSDLIASEDFVGGFEPRVGPYHLRILSVDGYPSRPHFRGLEWLHSRPYPVRSSHRWRPLSRETALRRIASTMQAWHRMRDSLRSAVSAGAGKPKTARAERDEELWESASATAMAWDARRARDLLEADLTTFGHMTWTVVTWAETREAASEQAADLLDALRGAGYVARLETVNAPDAYVGSLPGHRSNARRSLLAGLNLGLVMPLPAVWPGREHSPCRFYPPASPPIATVRTAQSVPFRVHLHSEPSDVGHTLVIGGTGAGKSVLANFLAMGFLRYPESQLVILDIGGSAQLTGHLAGGAIYRVGDDTGFRLQPFDRIDEPPERDWAADWVTTLFSEQNLTLTPDHHREIGRALDLLAGLPPERRTLREFQVMLRDRDLASAIHRYAASPLNGDTDSLRAGRVAVIDIGDILDQGFVAPLLLLLFRRIEQRLTGAPTLIVIEEAWSALSHPAYFDRVLRWLRTLRKRNAAVLLITQAATDLLDVQGADALLGSCPTRFYLPDPQATTRADAYFKMGLEGPEIAALADARPARDYYYSSPIGARMVDLDLGPLALSCLTAPDGVPLPVMLEQLEDLRRSHPDDWLPRWLERRAALEPSLAPTLREASHVLRATPAAFCAQPDPPSARRLLRCAS